jgi:hypothetical protein
MDPVTLKSERLYTSEQTVTHEDLSSSCSKNIPSVVLIKQHFSVPKEADVREADLA